MTQEKNQEAASFQIYLRFIGGENDGRVIQKWCSGKTYRFFPLGRDAAGIAELYRFKHWEVNPDDGSWVAVYEFVQGISTQDGFDLIRKNRKSQVAVPAG